MSALNFDTVPLVLGAMAATASVTALAATELVRRRRRRLAAERATAELIATLRQENEALRLRAAENERLLQLLPESLKQVVNIRLPESEVSTAAVRQVNVAVRSVKTLLDPDVIAFFFRDARRGVLKLQGGLGIPDHLRPSAGRDGLVLPLPEGAAGLAEQLGALEGVEGLAIDLAAPILSHDELLGVVAIGGGRQSPTYRKWLLALVAELTAVAILAARGRKELVHESTTDPLTGLANRKHLMTRFRMELDRAEAYGAALSVLLIDVDHFKQFNDTNGHPAGDDCLRTVARVLHEVTRGSDIVARYGGEEFVVVTVDADKGQALGHAERIRAAVEAAPIAGARSPSPAHVTISAGVATYPEDGRPIEDLVAAADAALYRAKEGGRNRVVAARPAAAGTGAAAARAARTAPGRRPERRQSGALAAQAARSR
ncbi:MAG TPA: GGDEF domain-containing protein [Thermodesulfobacteriota bacterium]